MYREKSEHYVQIAQKNLGGCKVLCLERPYIFYAYGHSGSGEKVIPLFDSYIST